MNCVDYATHCNVQNPNALDVPAGFLSDLVRFLASNYLIDFIMTTFPTYQCKWYHKLLCDKLDALLAGTIKKLMVFMPPQRGKSEIVSRRFPAFALGRNPKLQIAGCSYSSDLAGKFNREVQRIIDDSAYREIFPDVQLNSKNVVSDSSGNWLRNSDVFEIVSHGGSYRGVGVLGPLTGNTVDIGIIDDPIKDRLEAQSETFRNRLWEWYSDVFCTRLHNESRILLTTTRWHEDDLAGRILAKEKDWTVLSLPELREDMTNPDDPRQIDEPLWPERHDLKTTLEIKHKSERTFISMYQQRPAPSAGRMFKKKWFRYYNLMPPRFDRIIQSWDCTFKDTASSDYVVGTIWGKRGADSFLLGMARGKWDFVETVQQIKRVHAMFPACNEKLIEEKANGAAVISMLRQQIPGLVPIIPTESKEARAYAVSFCFESGNVYFPANCPWVSDVEHELLLFPNGRNDDIVDSITQALNRFYLQRVGQALSIAI